MAKVKRLAFDSISLAAKRPHARPLDLSSERRRSIMDVAASLGFEITRIAGHNDFADASAFD